MNFDDFLNILASVLIFWLRMVCVLFLIFILAIILQFRGEVHPVAAGVDGVLHFVEILRRFRWANAKLLGDLRAPLVAPVKGPVSGRWGWLGRIHEPVADYSSRRPQFKQCHTEQKVSVPSLRSMARRIISCISRLQQMGPPACAWNRSGLAGPGCLGGCWCTAVCICIGQTSDLQALLCVRACSQAMKRRLGPQGTVVLVPLSYT